MSSYSSVRHCLQLAHALTRLECPIALSQTECCRPPSSHPMLAGTQAFTQGPFAQDRPSTSPPPLAETVHKLPQPQLSKPGPNAEALQQMPQHDSTVPAVTGTDSAAPPPSSSFRFGSFSPDDVGKPQNVGLSFSELNQAPVGQLSSAFAQGQPQTASGQMQGSGHMQQPSGPPGQPAAAPSPAAQQYTANSQELLASETSRQPSSSTTAAASQPSIGGDGALASMHHSGQLPAHQAGASLPVSPLPARADSSASTSSPGQYAHDGMQLLYASQFSQPCCLICHIRSIHRCYFRYLCDQNYVPVKSLTCCCMRQCSLRLDASCR